MAIPEPAFNSNGVHARVASDAQPSERGNGQRIGANRQSMPAQPLKFDPSPCLDFP